MAEIILKATTRPPAGHPTRSPPSQRWPDPRRGVRPRRRPDPADGRSGASCAPPSSPSRASTPSSTSRSRASRPPPSLKEHAAPPRAPQRPPRRLHPRRPEQDRRGRGRRPPRGRGQAVADDNGVVDQILTSLLIIAKPADIPSGLTIDISGLEIGSTSASATSCCPTGVTTDVDPEESVVRPATRCRTPRPARATRARPSKGPRTEGAAPARPATARAATPGATRPTAATRASHPLLFGRRG